MNCVKGDLAIYVGTRIEHIGKIVMCVRLAKEWEFAKNCRDGLPAWDVEPPLFGSNCSVYDYSLRPIRDQDGQDETLQWTDVPHKETA